MSLFRGEIIPKVGFAIVASDILMDSARMGRMHRRLSKQSAHAAMLLHWKKYLPRHFKQVNRDLYNHAKRDPKYEEGKRKRRGTSIDIVKTGRTRDYMTNLIPMIRHSGSADSLMITTMYLRWPFPAGKVKKGQVSREQMNQELSRWVDEEEEDIIKQYASIYTASLKTEIKNSPRLSKRYTDLGVI